MTRRRAAAAVAAAAAVESGSEGQTTRRPATRRRGAASAAPEGGTVGATSTARKKKVPSLAPKKTPRKRAANGKSLELNLAYIDSSAPVIEHALARAAAPAAAPDKGANLLDQIDKAKWMEEQAALTASLNSMYV